MMKYFFLLPAVLFLSYSPLLAQPARETENRCILQLDKSFYVTGEIVWYHLTFPPYEGFDSVVVELAIRNSNGRVLERHFTRTREGGTDGYFKVPYDWASGVYHFTFRAMHLDASPVELVSAPLPIYNDLTFDPNLDFSGTPAGAGRLPQKKEPALLLHISTNKAVYRPREKVRAIIEVKDAEGRPADARLSVSVVDAVLCGEATTGLPSIHYGVELKGTPRFGKHRLLAGQVTDKTGRPHQTFYLAAFQSASRQLIFSRSDSSGRFYFEFPDFYGRQPIQFIDYKIPDIQVTLPQLEEQPEPRALPFNETIGRYLQLSRRRKKINKVFQTREMLVHPLFSPIDTGRFTADQELRIADYRRMEDVPTFFRELSTPLKIRRKGGQYTARMFNPAREARRFYPGDPVFIIDGQVTRDADFIGRLPLEEIQQIDLFFDSENLRKQFGPLGRQGIVDISSGSGSVQVPEGDAQNIFSVSGFQPAAAFPAAVPADGQAPLFRPQLWWAPRIKTGEQGRAVIEFPNSDSRSTFRITVLARDAEGNIAIGTILYEVSGLRD